jgi:hypothetical protein
MLKPTMNAASDLPISAKGDYATCSPELPDEKPFDMLRAEEDPHVPPTRFHAKPLPRLGCGGPSQCKQTEESGINQTLNGEICARSKNQLEKPHDQTDLGTPTNAITPSQEMEDAFVSGMLQVAQRFETDAEAFSRGAVPGFSTGVKPQEVSEQEPHAKKRRVEDPAQLSSTQIVHNHELADQVKSASLDDAHDSACHQMPPEDQIDEVETESVEVQVIAEGSLPHAVRMPWGQTAGQLVVAHAKLTQQEASMLAINSAMDSQIPLTSVLMPDMVVRIDNVNDVQRGECKSHLSDHCQKAPILTGDTRQEHLWEQRGWVAVDEMEFYMHMLSNSYPGTFHFPKEVQAADDGHLTQVILDLILEVGKSNTHAVFAPILTEHHWYPVVVMPYHDKVAIWTPKLQAQKIQRAVQNMLGQHPIEVFPTAFPQSFPMDCGFQTVGWMISMASFDQEFRAISDQHATQWRCSFHQHLIATGQHVTKVLSPIKLGGMKADIDQLTALLVEHGVAQARSAECADMIISNLGSGVAHKLLQSPKPWADLKARANLCKPPLRIVLPEELRGMIQSKMDSGKPIGRKNNKVKTSRPGIGDIRLKADQIIVPNAVFKQQDGAELGHLNPSQINATSRGIIVVNYEDAKPYFGINQAMTSEGLGLLVLDHHDTRLPNNHTIVRVPALCKATSEPLLATAALFQLGQKTVMRNLPEECIEVQETPYAVVRVALYRDQAPVSWESVIAGPVKQMMNIPTLQGLQQADVMDVWDRQFLDDRLKKAEPSQAAIVMVNIRIGSKNLEDVLSGSGVSGCYIEQRTPDGHAPHPDFQVIWLPRKTYAEATVAQQSNKTPCKLARSGNRYGLRVSRGHAEQTHNAHRPDVIYLQGNDLQRFKVGPLPFGSSKASIATLFRKWNWQARPLGPIGPSRDKSGIMWHVQSASNPEHWIYQASHGDILISPDAQQTTQPPAKQAIIASEKTLQSLAKPTSLAVPDSEDPWLHKDPWRNSNPAPAAAPLNAQQFAELAQTMEQRLAKHMTSEDKMEVDTDRRVADLESKVGQLTQDLATFQHHQGKQQQIIQNQVAAIDAKVDSQQQSIHNMLESKLENQMARIEQLFAKRAKTSQE